jgi:hypothetical protein
MSEPTLMTTQEIHNFGIDIVLEYIQKEGYKVKTVRRDQRKNPQIIARKENVLVYILVRTACYPNKGELEDNNVISRLKFDAYRNGAICYFASVGIANTYGSSDLDKSIALKGSKYHVSFDGLVHLVKKPKKEEKLNYVYNQSGEISGKVKQGIDGRHTLIFNNNTDISSVTMSNFLVFANIFWDVGRAEDKRKFFIWSRLPSGQWSQAHQELFALAMMHFIMEIKSKDMISKDESSQKVISAIKSFPPQALAPLPHPLSDDMRSIFADMLSIS